MVWFSVHVEFEERLSARRTRQLEERLRAIGDWDLPDDVVYGDGIEIEAWRHPLSNPDDLHLLLIQFRASGWGWWLPLGYRCDGRCDPESVALHGACHWCHPRPLDEDWRVFGVLPKRLCAGELQLLKAMSARACGAHEIAQPPKRVIGRQLARLVRGRWLAPMWRLQLEPGVAPGRAARDVALPVGTYMYGNKPELPGWSGGARAPVSWRHVGYILTGKGKEALIHARP